MLCENEQIANAKQRARRRTIAAAAPARVHSNPPASARMGRRLWVPRSEVRGQRGGRAWNALIPWLHLSTIHPTLRFSSIGLSSVSSLSFDGMTTLPIRSSRSSWICVVLIFFIFLVVVGFFHPLLDGVRFGRSRGFEGRFHRRLKGDHRRGHDEGSSEVTGPISGIKVERHRREREEGGRKI